MEDEIFLLIEQLKQDVLRTKEKLKKSSYIDFIRKARLKAFITKTNEIIERLNCILWRCSNVKK